MPFAKCDVCGVMFHHGVGAVFGGEGAPKVCGLKHPMLHRIRSFGTPREFFECDPVHRGAATHRSRPVLVRPLTAKAAIVRCTGRTRKGRTCGSTFVAFG